MVDERAHLRMPRCASNDNESEAIVALRIIFLMHATEHYALPSKSINSSRFGRRQVVSAAYYLRYEDCEYFYSQEVERLPQKVGVAGYVG